jgi:hypothetical protein
VLSPFRAFAALCPLSREHDGAPAPLRRTEDGEPVGQRRQVITKTRNGESALPIGMRASHPRADTSFVGAREPASKQGEVLSPFRAFAAPCPLSGEHDGAPAPPRRAEDGEPVGQGRQVITKTRKCESPFPIGMRAFHPRADTFFVGAGEPAFQQGEVLSRYRDFPAPTRSPDRSPVRECPVSCVTRSGTRDSHVRQRTAPECGPE